MCQVRRSFASIPGSWVHHFVLGVEGAILAILGYLRIPLALLGALVGSKRWGKVVAFERLILSQIGFILTELS